MSEMPSLNSLQSYTLTLKIFKCQCPSQKCANTFSITPHIRYVIKPRELRSPKASVSHLLFPNSCHSPSRNVLTVSHLSYCKEPPRCSFHISYTHCGMALDNFPLLNSHFKSLPTSLSSSDNSLLSDPQMSPSPSHTFSVSPLPRIL